MKLKQLITLATLGAALAATVAIASSGGSAVSADEALARLMEGNARFVQNQMTGTKLCNIEARTALATSQKPYAIILCCSDSRVPPELIFDKGLGELFIVRVAGNIPDPVVLGSVEYAAEHLGSPLVMVLGHERCGAVTASVNATGKPEGNIGAIVKAITPAVKKAKAQCGSKEKPQLVECAIDQNVRMVAANLTRQSKVLAHLAKEGKIRIVSAKYDLDDGTVTLFDK
jgi:carbonic anhydrase